MKKIFFLILFTSASLAMQKPVSQDAIQTTSSNPLQTLPSDIQLEIFKYLPDNFFEKTTLDDAVRAIKKLYIASPRIRASDEINQRIILYLVDRYKITSSQTLQQLVNNLNAFPTFSPKNEKMKIWLEKLKKKIDIISELKTAIDTKNVAKVKDLLETAVQEKIILTPEFLDSLLYSAMVKNNIEIVKLLIDKGANVNFNNKGRTPLMSSIALVNVDSAIVQHLLDKGARVNAQDDNGNTALIWAFYVGPLTDREIKIIKLLLDHAADPNITNKEGMSALSLVIGTGHKNPEDSQAVKLLLERGANPNIGTYRTLEKDKPLRKTNQMVERTPLQMARKRNEKELETLLLEHGAK